MYYGYLGSKTVCQNINSHNAAISTRKVLRCILLYWFFALHYFIICYTSQDLQDIDGFQF